MPALPCGLHFLGRAEGAPPMMALPGPGSSRSFPDQTSLSSLSPGAQDVRVQVAAEVRGNLGDTVELPCHLLPSAPEIRVSQVTWLRLDAPEGEQNVAIFHPQYGRSFPSPKPGKERLSFVNPAPSAGARQGMELEDATLSLRGLTVEDEGNYTCEFATFPKGTSRGVTWLRVIGEPVGGLRPSERGRGATRERPPRACFWALAGKSTYLVCGHQSAGRGLLSTCSLPRIVLQGGDTAGKTHPVD